MRRLHVLVGTINGDLDLGRTLEAVCQGIVDGLGFEVGVVNLARPDGSLEVVAVAGSTEARTALLGQVGTAAQWTDWMGLCSPVGQLLVDYSGGSTGDGDVPTWIPAPRAPAPGDGQAWHPLDALLAPLRTSRSGLLGVISVDLPEDGRRPGPEQLELLEMYAAQASLAIENAALHTALVARDADAQEVVGRLSALLAEAPVAIVELDLDGNVRLWNPEAERIFGWRTEEVVGRPNPVTFVDRDQYAARLDEIAAMGSTAKVEVVRRRKDGSTVQVSMSSSLLRDDTGTPFGFIGVMADITERVVLEQELRHAAFHDALTGLPNRAHFAERLADATGHMSGGAVLLLDLDGFKAVNDSLGHGAGDEVLVQVAQRLRQTCRSTDVVARLGGDEFVVLVADPQVVRALAARVLEVLSAPFEVAGRTVTLGCSLGIAPVSAGTGADDLLRDADTAMYAAKAGGKGRAQLFEPALRARVLERSSTAADLRLAVPRGQLALRWHPVVDLRSGALVALEALLRWQHPDRGELAPGAFIGLAEQTGLIVPVGEWVLHEACRQAQVWRQEHPQAQRLTVSVNVSPVQLRSPDIVAHVRSALADSALDPRRLVLELTEDVLVEDVDAAVRVLGRLRDLGVRLALDDFGAGYSSLRYLKRLPVELVKLDRELVTGVDTDPEALALVDAVLAMVMRLGRTAVVEGVETAAQRRALEGLGAPLAQGFLFGRPMKPADAALVVAAGRVA